MALAKTTRPGVAGAMPRPRLFRRLDRSRRRPITWVWGPPGTGKTTLLAGYLAARRLRSLWYQVDAGDADVAAFFYYLGLAVPARGKPLPLLTPEYRAGLDVFARRYFRQLFGRLRPPFVLVLDNYQDVPPDALLHDVLREAAEELPPTARIVVISRAEPPAALARLRIHQAVDTIDWSELRLTRTEAARLARTLSVRPRSSATTRRICEMADGWIAGLVLLLQQDADEPPPGSPPPARSQLLFDYFAAEIFKRREPRTREVLLQTAYLPSISAEAAEAVTGRPDAGRVVAELHRQNYFTNKRAGADAVYEYHPLFREFLLAEARRTLGEERIAEIRRTAAGLVEASGQIEAAADLLRAAGDGEALARVICRYAPALLAQGRVDTVEEWLARVPEAVLTSHPWLLCWRGVCRLGRRHDDCRRDCEQALAAFRLERDTDGALFAWSVIVVCNIMAGWLASVDVWIARLDALLAEAAGPTSPEVEARVATAMLLAIAFRQPSHPDGARWAARAVELARGHPDLSLRAVAATSWFIYHWQRGDLSKASYVVEDMRALAERRDIPSVISLLAAVPLVWHDLVWALPSYHQTVVDLRAHARATGLSHVSPTLLCCWGAFAALSDGDGATARAWIAEMAPEIAELGPTYAVAYQGLLTLEALARDDLEQARAHERELARAGYTSGMPNEEALARVTAAYVCHRRNQDREARAHLERVLEIAAGMPSPYLEWMARLADAHRCFGRGHDAAGLRSLRTAMELGRAGGYVNSAVWVPAIMAPLCARALEEGIEVEYVRGLVKRRRLVCDPPPVEVEAWPWPVKVFTLGRFAVLQEDRPLRSGAKVQKKPLALLKAIIVFGTPGVPEERLMDTLWPDADGDAARRALTSAVFRLRRLLRHEHAVMRGGGEIRLDPSLCWVDVWALERLLDRAEAASASPDGERAWADAVRWTERAAALHRGPLLGTADDAAWSGALADRVRRRLLRQLLAVARHAQDSLEWQAAADLLEKALRVDPCAEPAYRQLMTAYRRLGRPAEVRAIYARCRETLERQLGVRPSPATEAVLNEA
jgi:DNA-binding SARP family transcriptional activator